MDSLRFFGGLEIAAKAQAGLVVTRVLAGSAAEGAGIRSGHVLSSLLIKKDWGQAQRDDARWRPVHDLEAFEKLMPLAYADLDFFLGLRLKAIDGSKQDLFLSSLLMVTPAF
ncbi:MAG: hypothetical protein HYS34_08805, partial [Acidobacteria bacterium]|nr:hypothetical protein [Acidobacteriota bacterium]